MQSVGIVCEYNPYHAGHAHQISTLRAQGAECIICVMSGSYTQRGEPAIADKYTRAEAVLCCGADIVLELPFPYSSLSAEGFSRAGAYILDAVGADCISFGSECGDLSPLSEAARIISSDKFAEAYANAQRATNTSAAAFFEAYRQISGQTADFRSNDLLGISYIRAINELGLSLTPRTIKRTGSEYNDEALGNGFPSATALRALIRNGGLCECRDRIPQNALDVLIRAERDMLFPVDENRFFTVLQAFFRINTAGEIKKRATELCGGESILDDGDGIVERICECACTSSDMEEFYSKVSGTRYTNSRIRRVILYSLFGVSDTYRTALPEYTLLLGATARGREHLSRVRKDAKIKIVTKPADIPKCTDATLSCRADALYAMLLPKAHDGGYFIKHSPHIV